MYIFRHLENKLKELIGRKKSILLLGPRQTGKSTLLTQIPSDLSISLLQSRIRLRYEADPQLLEDEIIALREKYPSKILPLIVIDEIQKVPELMDSVQYLIDHNQAQFILTGSSAKKLRRGHTINLLPGRLQRLRLDPLQLSEMKNIPKLEDLLSFGSLPRMILLSTEQEKNEELISYVTTYLDEEVREEAIVRKIGVFSRFLELFGSESGKLVNFSKCASDIGIGVNTIRSYFEILEDCLVAERVMPYSETKALRRLIKTPKYLFFDLGMRRIAAKEGQELPRNHMGYIFEQFIGLECIRYLRPFEPLARFHFWRDSAGHEVDWVVETPELLIPMEVKWTDKPIKQDAKHLQLFLNEYEKASHGFVICKTPRRFKLTDQVTAIPWQECADWGTLLGKI